MSATLVIEREFRHKPEKLWRALTQPHLIADWLMANDFEPVVDRPFRLTADWGAVDCRVLEIAPNRTLAYSWAAMGLESTVTFTLTAIPGGTHLRLEQAGFADDRDQNYRGAVLGWGRFLGRFDEVLARLD